MSKQDELPGLSDLEREVMEVVWKADDEISVRRVAERILAAPRVTVQVGPGRLRDAG